MDLDFPSDVIPQKHNKLSQKLLGSKIQPIPETQPERKNKRNYLESFTFSWLDHILRVGYDRVLVFQDIPKVLPQQSVDGALADYKQYISTRSRDQDYVEIWALLYAFRKTIFWSCILQGCAYAATIGQSVISRKLITAVEELEINKTVSRGPASGYTIGNTLMGLFSISAIIYADYIQESMVKQIRTLAIAAMHEKILLLSPQQRSDFSAGKITSILASDTARGTEVLMYISQAMLFPFYLAAVIGVLIYNIGVSSLAGIAILIFLLGANMISAVFSGKLRLASMPLQDKRVSLIRETVKSMTIVKFYGWEGSFTKLISAIRIAETWYIRMIALLSSITNSLIVAGPSYAGALAFAVRTLTGKQLKPAEAFPSLTLFSMFIPIFSTMTVTINAAADAWVACKRINEFFRLPVIPRYIQSLDLTDESNDNVIIRLKGVTLAWDVSELSEDSTIIEEDQVEEKACKTILSDVNLSIYKGTFNVVVGTVGSGKTSLLSTFVGNIPLKHGTVEILDKHKASSVLSRWARNATIRENILFGHQWNPSLYEKVVHICDLTSDFEQFLKGDLTEVGENGVTLSGGQLARLALARCLYSDRSIIILDDVLSAMDARVGSFILKRLLDLVRVRKKTIIFATNNLNTLEHADSIIVLDGKGGCTQQDRNGGITNRELNEIKQNTAEDNIQDAPLEEKFSVSRGMRDSAEKSLCKDGEELLDIGNVCDFPKLTQVNTNTSAVSVIPTSMKMLAEDKEGKKDNKGNVVIEENRAVGSVKFKVLSRYFKLTQASGLALALSGLVIAMIYATSYAMQNVVLSWWTSDKYGMSQGFNIGMYCLVISVSAVGYICLANVFSYYCTMSTSDLFHDALKGVYRAPMVFFQQNPLGRIMTRFTEDIVNLDTQLRMEAQTLVFAIMRFLGSLIVVFVYVPWSIICLVPMLLMILMFAAFYRTASRELNRVNQLCEGRMMTAVSENIEGQDVIVAFDMQDHARSLIMDRSNQLIGAFLCSFASHYWVALRITTICEILTLVTVFLAVFQVIQLDTSSVGMLISTLASAAASLTIITPHLAILENQLNSVERLNDYAFEIQQEEDEIGDDDDAEKKPVMCDWHTTEGKISFNDVCLRYGPDLPLALNHLSFQIGGGKKLGICGRTGAGKSTIVAAIFRLTELSAGSITIDGQSIADIRLSTLRRALTIIPQQPVLFQGTIRSNLDPFNEKTDVELWDALNRTGVVGNQESTKFHLDSKVDADGSNFSLGERQMLSLTRALVRNTKILILDEATAAVDEQTDNAIQEVIRTQFNHCTVICIAHRLKTIMNYDEVMVLAPGGELLEKGAPQELLASSGEFAALAKEAEDT